MLQPAGIDVPREACGPLEPLSDWKFYNGRHQTTVLHAIAKIDGFRTSDESVDALIEVLTGELAGGSHKSVARIPPSKRSALVEAVAARVIDRLAELKAD